MAGKETILRKLSPLVALAFTTLISALLLVYRHRRDIGSLNVFVRNNRDSVAIIIQILASVLGFCSMYAVCSAANFSSRLYLGSHAITLQTLHVWSLVVNPHLDLSLPAHLSSVILVWCVLTRIPAAIVRNIFHIVYIPYFQTYNATESKSISTHHYQISTQLT